MTAQPITVTVAGESVTVNTDVTVNGTGSGNRIPTGWFGDDPNPAWDGSVGRYPVSPYPVPAGFLVPDDVGLVGAGVPISSLTPMAAYTVNTDGAIIEGKDITGKMVINADNVTIRRCRLTSATNGSVLDVNGSGFVIEDSRLRSVGNVGSIVGSAAKTIRRCFLTGGNDNIGCRTGTFVYDSVLTGCYRATGTHNDCIQSTGGNGMVISGCTIIGPYKQSTSAILFKTDNAAITNATIAGNYLSGGSYTLFTRQHTYPVTDLTVTNNTFEVDSSNNGTWSNTVPAGELTSSGNIDYDPR